MGKAQCAGIARESIGKKTVQEEATGRAKAAHVIPQPSAADCVWLNAISRLQHQEKGAEEGDVPRHTHERELCFGPVSCIPAWQRQESSPDRPEVHAVANLMDVSYDVHCDGRGHPETITASDEEALIQVLKEHAYNLIFRQTEDNTGLVSFSMCKRMRCHEDR